MKKEEIWIYAETNLNNIHPVTYQLITKAKEIGEDKKIVVLLLNNNPDIYLEKIKEYGPDEIIVIKNDSLLHARDSLIADLLKQLVNTRNPNTILFGATVLGRSISARLQAKLETGLTADCLDLKYEKDLLIQTKPSYGDNIMCEIICPDARPQMATVRPNIFTSKKNNKDALITNVSNLEFVIDDRITLLDEQILLSKGDSIANASRVIALGRGASSKDVIIDAKLLATKLGAKIGVTRPLTDLDEFSQEDQIGQSGNTISPRLLINLGVHGAVQFTSGIQKSEIIVAVNNNPDAPIIKESDYYFIGDSKDFLKELLKLIQ